MNSIVFACGGTGGHIYPALAMAEELKKMNVTIHFIGTKNHIEADLIPANGYPISFITISGFHRSFRLVNLLFPFKLLLGLIQSKRLLKQLKPALVIGTGGYVCGPVLYQAAKMKISTMIQEQNSYPGVTTRLLQSRVDEIHIAYDYAKQFLKNAKQLITSGNPIRKINALSKTDARQQLNLTDQFTILIIGGSQGARSINEAMKNILTEFSLESDFNLIWQTGKKTYSNYAKIASKDRIVEPYFDDMNIVYSAADLIICRAGAMSLAEITAYHLPALIIPLNSAAANHQFYNAKSYENAGAAVLIKDDDELEDRLKFELKRLISDSEELKEMSEKIESFETVDATKKLVESALNLMNKKNELSSQK